jgi:hypothetical protein
MISYSSPLRKTVKWCKKLAFELLLNTCIVNSLVLYKLVIKKCISVTDFRMKLALHLMKCSNEEPNSSFLSSTTFVSRHELKKIEGPVKKMRQFCKACYNKNSLELGRTKAKNYTKKVVNSCLNCEDSNFFCLECCNLIHRKRKEYK